MLAARLSTVSLTAPIKGHAGRVVVRFQVGRQGNVLWKRVVKSSKDPYLDAGALVIIDRMSPFPPLPTAIKEKMVFQMPFDFRGR